MPEPSQQPRLDIYAQDLLRQSYQGMPISQDILSQYGQGMAQQVQPPIVENYAPQQQFQQQSPMTQQPQRTLQPSQKRMEYNALVDQRFNEIADMVGGMEVLYKTGRVDKARKAALEDIQSIYGEPPAIEQPISELERVELAQAKRNLEQDMQEPKMTPMERLQLKEQRMKLAKLEEEAKNPSKKPSDLVTQIGKDTSTYLAKQTPMIGQLENAIKLAENPKVPINEKLASMKLIGKLMNSVMVGTSDAVSQDEAAVLLSEVNEKIRPDGLWTSASVFGNDLPQFVSKLKNLRDSVANEYNNSIDLVSKIDPEISKIFEKKTLYSQSEGMPAGQPAAKPEVEEYYDPVTGWTTKPPAQ
jgi:hypothetical protein